MVNNYSEYFGRKYSWVRFKYFRYEFNVSIFKNFSVVLYSVPSRIAHTRKIRFFFFLFNLFFFCCVSTRLRKIRFICKWNTKSFENFTKEENKGVRNKRFASAKMKVLLPHKIKSEEFSLYRSSRGTRTKLCDVFPVLISAVPASFLPWKSQRFRTAHQKGLKGEIEFLWNFKALKLLLENFVQNSQPDYFQSKIVSIDFPTSFRLPIPRRDFRIHFISFFFFSISSYEIEKCQSDLSMSLNHAWTIGPPVCIVLSSGRNGPGKFDWPQKKKPQVNVNAIVSDVMR